MVDDLLRIAITTEEIGALEPSMIAATLDAGWDMVHLRHPDASLRDMRNLIEAVPQRHHHRLRLHGHFTLLESFNLGGIHLNKRCPVPPPLYSGPHSRSCHSVREVMESSDCDYVTLSPIFDSISKKGYSSKFDKKDLIFLDKNSGSVVTTKVVALGGVTPERIDIVRQLGFDGFAVLGALLGSSSMADFQSNLALFGSNV